MLIRVLSRTFALAALGAVAGVSLGGPYDFGSGWTIGSEFTGSNINQSGFIPPDTMGAVGTNQFTELLNGRYAVYDRAGSLQQSSSLDQFWTNAGVSVSGAFSFDPRVAYDASAGRWYASSLDAPGDRNSFLFAVSNTADPTQGWRGFKIDTNPTAQARWGDFDTLGFNSDGVYLAADMYGISDNSFSTAVAVIPKAALLGGSPTSALLEDLNWNATGYAVQPVVDLDNSGTPEKFFGDYGSGWIQATKLTGTVNAPGIAADTDVFTSPYGIPPDAVQKGSPHLIATNDTRLASSIVRIGGKLFLAHTVNVNGRAGIHYAVIDATTNATITDGFLGDANMDYYFGSIAANANGDLVISMSGSSANDYVGTYTAVGHFDGSSVTLGAVHQLQAGAGSYYVTYGGAENRWGDYSATMIDPNNPNSFWTIQEYAVAQNTWATRITQINLAVPEPASIAVFGLGLLALARRRRSRR